jgi:putative tricarboxylic transport membrane protein
MDVFQTTAAAVPDVLTRSVLLYTIGGLTLGIIWGAMPALSTTMAMALLVGFSAGLGLHEAIAFLLAVYVGSVYGGSISAICINIPGTPAAACTAMEGYPLFRRGEGGRALGTAIVASSFGNVIGAFVLILLVPHVLDLSLGVGAWEMFLLGLWGVMLSGSISDAPPLKGWLSGLIGLSLAFIGLDPISGAARFTFGLPWLYGGLSFVAVLIGLFGFAEIARGLVFEKDGGSTVINRVSVNWRALVHNIRSIAVSSGIGTFIGILPAAGADTAAYVSYAVSRQTGSPEERAQYGKGSYRGIIAADTANSASIGGSLLPTMILAVPGATADAAFMGALNLQGIVVGPMIGVYHPGVLEFTLASFLVTSILFGLVAYLLAHPAVYLLSIPRRVLLPSILPICVLGAFAAQNSVTDIYVMLIFGVAALVLMTAGIPLAPLIMGVILGPLVDQNFRRAILVYENQGVIDVLTRPVGTILLLILTATLVGPFLIRRRSKSPTSAPSAAM